MIQLRDGHPTVDYTPSASPTELLEGAEVVLGRVRSGVRAEGWWSIEVETDDGVRRVSVPGRPEPGRLELTTEAPLVLAIGGPADDAPTGFAVVPEGLYVACEADDVAIAVVAAPSWALGTSLALLAG